MKTKRLSYKQVKTAVDAYNKENGLGRTDKGFLRIVNSGTIYELCKATGNGFAVEPLYGQDGTLRSVMYKLEEIKADN